MSEQDIDTRFISLIFDTTLQGIFTIDAKGCITSFNRTAENLTGYSRGDVIGRPCTQIFKTELCEIECPLKRPIAARERSEAAEANIVTKDGRLLPVAISTATLADEEGKILGAVEMFRDLSEVSELRKRLAGTYVFEDIVGKSLAMRRVFEMLPLVANSQSNVLIEGESGAGKELAARVIHNLSARRTKPFVGIHCAALPDQLLEREFFGYKRGAFADARKDTPGRLAIADGGTVMLNEIGELSPSMQAKVLHVIESREYTPVGDNRPTKTDVRIIACTSKHLAQEIRKKRFRSDLYFRLNVVRISLPSLAERSEDIPLLVNHFIEKFNALQGRQIKRCSERATAALMGYSFPGNIRELENAIEHAFVICAGDTIHLEDLPGHIVTALTESATVAKAQMLPLDSAESETIRNVLSRHFGNRNRTAAELGISRNTLWRKMKRYGIA